MSKEINLSEIGDWSDEEAWFNVKYLEDRGQFADAAKVRSERGFPNKGYPTGDSFQLDPHQLVTSGTGTNDSPEDADKEGTNFGPGASAGGQVGPHGPNADQFDPSSDGGDDSSRGSASWVRNSTIDEVVSWVEEADAGEGQHDRAMFALAAEEDKTKPRTTLRDELEPYLTTDNE